MFHINYMIMNKKILNKEIEFYRNLLISEKSNIENYYLKHLYGLSESTIYNHLISISKLFESNEQRDNTTPHDKKFRLKHSNVDLLSEKEIKDLFYCRWFKGLSKSTQKNFLSRINSYLEFSNRSDLIECLPTNIKSKTKQISKVDLINRDELDLILNNCGIKTRTLLMIMYDGALRKSEVLNIKRMHIRIKGKFAVLKVAESKTTERDIPLYESLPYIREYLSINDFKPNDKLFNYKNDNTLNSHLLYITKKITKKYPKKWNGKKLYPHLFRHSRLTELALSRLNEPQIRKFAGWTAGSNMPEVYFHLDDSDLKEILVPEYIEKRKSEKKKEKEPKICPICTTENNQENLFCWRCGNVFKEMDENGIVVELITQPYKIEQLREENKELQQKLSQMEEVIDKIPNLLEDFENIKNELYNLKMTESLAWKLKKDITDKEIIETLGLKEIPKTLGKKLITK